MRGAKKQWLMSAEFSSEHTRSKELHAKLTEQTRVFVQWAMSAVTPDRAAFAKNLCDQATNFCTSHLMALPKSTLMCGITFANCSEQTQKEVLVQYAKGIEWFLKFLFVIIKVALNLKTDVNDVASIMGYLACVALKTVAIEKKTIMP